MNWSAVLQTLAASAIVGAIVSYSTAKVLEERMTAVIDRVERIERTIDYLHPRTGYPRP